MAFLARVFDTSPKEDSGDSFDFGTAYELLKCPSCHKATLRCYYWHDLDTSGEVSFSQLYPTDARIPLGLPEAIEKAFRAALKVKPVDANAFGVLIGRVIEMVCRDRGADGHFLSHKLRDLATKGEIPAKLAEVAEKLSALRNIGAHAELGDLTVEEVPIIEDLCRALLDYLYTAPSLAQSAAARLAKLKK